MRKLIVGSIFSVLAAFSQDYANFIATKSTALTATAEVITIQQPASSAKFVRFKGAYVACSVACTVTLERNGTAATSTTLAPVKANPQSATAATAKAWSASNVGVGTVLSVYPIAAGGSIVIDLSDHVFNAASTAQNLTLRTNAITGTAYITIQWTEGI
jgi:hypothetical protein